MSTGVLVVGRAHGRKDRCEGMPSSVSATDWQTIALIAIGALCSVVWWEVRQLRKAKHSSAQVTQWCVFAIGVLAKNAGVELPELKRGDG